jgi:hypothetical protein
VIEATRRDQIRNDIRNKRYAGNLNGNVNTERSGKTNGRKYNTQANDGLFLE